MEFKLENITTQKFFGFNN